MRLSHRYKSDLVTSVVRRGFTLVELMVVIGIVSLLISILLPALTRARQTARDVQCLSNLHQLGVAFQIYANQNEGWWPKPCGTAATAPTLPRRRHVMDASEASTTHFCHM